MSVKNKREEGFYCENGYINRCCPSSPKRAALSNILDCPTSTLTVLDVLEVDVCRRAVLNYIPVWELLRTESVCRRWRDAMHHYIRGARRARRRLYITAPWHHASTQPGCMRLPLDEADPGFARTLYKWGTSVEAASFTVDSFPTIAEHCPYLQELTIYGLPDADLVRANLDKLEKLIRLAFRNFTSGMETNEQVPDEIIAIFLQKDTLEELTIVGYESFTGTSLKQLKTNLTCLRFQDCPTLDHNNLISALNRLKELKSLDLTSNSSVILQNLHLVLDMSKLRHLELCCYDKVVCDRILQVFRRLRNLEHVNLRHNSCVNDDWLAAVAGGGNLRSLDVSYCEGVTSQGLLAACRAAGRTLTALGAAGNGELTDELVEMVIRLCPYLRLLDIEECRGVSAKLVGYLARLVRRRRRWRLPELRLRLRGTAVPESTPPLRSLLLDFSRHSHLSAEPDEHENEPDETPVTRLVDVWRSTRYIRSLPITAR